MAGTVRIRMATVAVAVVALVAAGCGGEEEPGPPGRAAQGLVLPRC